MLLPNAEEFMTDMLNTMQKKNHDYTWGENNDYKNFELVETLGITDVKRWILIRMCDKMARLSSLIDKEWKVKDESLIDTLLDMSNYCIILASYIKDHEKPKGNTWSNWLTQSENGWGAGCTGYNWFTFWGDTWKWRAN